MGHFKSPIWNSSIALSAEVIENSGASGIARLQVAAGLLGLLCGSQFSQAAWGAQSSNCSAAKLAAGGATTVGGAFADQAKPSFSNARSAFMNDTIWYSCTLHVENLSMPFRYDPAFVDGKKLMSANNRNWSGEVLPSEVFPSKLVEMHEEDPEYRIEKKKQLSNLPDVFDSSEMVVSKNVLNVFDKFDMGKAQFHPISLYSDDGNLLSDHFFIWNFGNIKETILPDASKNLDENRLSTGTTYRPPMRGLEGYVAVTADALDGPSIWVDPRVRRTLFATGQLVESLNAAGLDKYFQFRQCRIVS
ncbi:hypothetical protein FMN63_21835 [Stappia sp. BW2]|uniref:imm11 family protein n=1 Tax=Stappia sp. BW2 TaxID=2592622 RepID=UPI0011DEBFA5|nr:DUF1629 domain-containing protein [Stappia sp. BW2]TYC65078.1 hypothetical protein FMN63_21835 [Stappia sp. BW2]